MEWFRFVGKLSSKCIKVVVLTICITVLVSFAFELNNVLTSVVELSHLTRQVMEDSCQYANLESFRGSGVADYQDELQSNHNTIAMGNCYSIFSADDKTIPVVSGKFYEGSTETEAYTELFGKNNTYKTDYINWLTGALADKDSSYLNDNSYQMLQDIMKRGEDSPYFSYRITPLNLGFSYLDPTVLRKIFEWNLVNKLTASGIYTKDYRVRNTIHKDSNGNWYVRWKGWRIYIGEENTKVYVDPEERCQLLNLYNDNDVATFEDYTGLSVHDYLGQDGATEMDNSSGFGNKIKQSDIRSNKVLYDVRWDLTIGYDGILPIAMIDKLISLSGEKQATTVNNYTITGEIPSEIIDFDAYKHKDLGAEKGKSVINDDMYNPLFIDATLFTNRDTENSIGNNVEQDTSTKKLWDRTHSADSAGGNNLFNSNWTQNGTYSKETYGLAQKLHYVVVH